MRLKLHGSGITKQKGDIVVKYLNLAQKYLLAFGMLFTTVLLFVNVILRYFFHSAIFWAEEVLRYCIVWISFIGTAVCVQDDSHISIDILSSSLKPKGKRILKICLQIAGIIFSVFFFIVSIRFIGQIKATNQVSATIGNMPMYVIYLCMPISFILYFIHSAQQLISLLRNKGIEKEGTET